METHYSGCGSITERSSRPKPSPGFAFSQDRMFLAHNTPEEASSLGPLLSIASRPPRSWFCQTRKTSSWFHAKLTHGSRRCREKQNCVIIDFSRSKVQTQLNSDLLPGSKILTTMARALARAAGLVGLETQVLGRCHPDSLSYQ